MYLITTKFQEILLSGFRGVALTKNKNKKHNNNKKPQKARTDGLTDLLTDGSII